MQVTSYITMLLHPFRNVTGRESKEEEIHLPWSNEQIIYTSTPTPTPTHTHPHTHTHTHTHTHLSIYLLIYLSIWVYIYLISNFLLYTNRTQYFIYNTDEMGVKACMYVSVYVCLSVCMYVCMCVCIWRQ